MTIQSSVSCYAFSLHKVTRVHRTVCAEGLQGVPDKDIQDKMNVSDDVFEKCVETCKYRY